MDKLSINNDFVHMRKAVRQARVDVIRKLVREARKLKARKPKSNDTQLIMKFQQKAQKLGDDIIAIKKAKDDDVSKYALTSTRNPSEVLSDLNSIAEVRGLARLCIHKTIAERAVNFKNKYKDLNIDIEDMLAVGKKKQKKLRHIEVKERKKEEKQKDKNLKHKDVKRNEWMQNNVVEVLQTEPINETICDEKIEVSLTNHVNVVNTNLTEQHITDAEVDRRQTYVSQEKNSINLEKDIDNKTIENPKNNYVTPHIEKDDSCTSSDLDIENSNLDDSLNESEFSNENSEIELKFKEEEVNVISPIIKPNKNVRKSKIFDDELKPLTEKTVDTFFITDSGDNYLSTYVPKVIKDVDTEVDYGGVNRRQRRSQMFGHEIKQKKRKLNTEKRDQNVFGNKRIKNNFDVTRTQSKNINDKFINKEKTFAQSKFTAKESGKTIDVPKYHKSVTSDKLHPSWEAKKLVPKIVAFQGKKITFDD